MKKKYAHGLKSYEHCEKLIHTVIHECGGTKEKKAKTIYLEGYSQGYERALAEALGAIIKISDHLADDIP